MRLLVYGDSNAWGFPPDGSGLRFGEQIRWPCVMAARLGATLIEDALPGRTTAHDDAELYGHTMNGLTHLPGALLAHSPLDWVVIMLGTNDFKARFVPTAPGIAVNITRLVDCVHDTGGGPGPWDGGVSPKVAMVVPPPLPEVVDHTDFDRRDEWIGGREASVGLANCLRVRSELRDVAVFEAGSVIAGSARDPIHLDADSHIVLGRALAGWLQNMDEVKDAPA